MVELGSQVEGNSYSVRRGCVRALMSGAGCTTSFTSGGTGTGVRPTCERTGGEVVNVLAPVKARGIDVGLLLLLRQRDRRSIEASIVCYFEVSRVVGPNCLLSGAEIELKMFGFLQSNLIMARPSCFILSDPCFSLPLRGPRRGRPNNQK